MTPTTPPPNLELPTATGIRKALSDLFGHTLDVVPCPPMVLSPLPEETFVASYVLANGSVGFVWVLDLPLAAALGGALTLLPPGVIREAVAKRSLEGTITENLLEVMNVCSATISRSLIRVKLETLRLPRQPITPAVSRALAKPGSRLDCVATLRDCAPGKMTLLTAGHIEA